MWGSSQRSCPWWWPPVVYQLRPGNIGKGGVLIINHFWLCQAPSALKRKTKESTCFDWRRIDEIFSCSPIGIGTVGETVTVRIHDYREKKERMMDLIDPSLVRYYLPIDDKTPDGV